MPLSFRLTVKATDVQQQMHLSYYLFIKIIERSRHAGLPSLPPPKITQPSFLKYVRNILEKIPAAQPIHYAASENNWELKSF